MGSVVPLGTPSEARRSGKGNPAGYAWRWGSDVHPVRGKGLGRRVNGLVQFFSRLGMARLAAMATVAVLMLGFFAFLVMRATSPQLAPLYSGLSFEDSAAIVSELQKDNISYELRGDGETILVDRDQISTIRMNLAENGLPTRGQVGYEIFDQQSSLGATSFVQNINNVRALEGELARTISSLTRIKSARVHLVLPERALFSREQKDPTASIVLAVRGELSSGEIRAIQHLVASAVEGLTPMRVAIVDDAGQLLASGAGNGQDDLVAGEMEERRLSVEDRMRARVEDLLANIVGAGRARVQISAELDLNQLTKTSETFDPDGQVVRSTQTRDLANNSSGPGDNGQVTVANELPGGTQDSGAAGTQENAQTSEETTNYEISKTTQTQQTEAGGIKRLSVAVVVDGTYTTDASGNATYAPRPQAEIDQITSLVKSAIGFDANRGDQVEVANLQFASRPELSVEGTSAPSLFDFTRDDLMNLAETAVTLLIALALIFFVMRPLLRKALSPEAPLVLPPSAELIPAGMSPAMQHVERQAAQLDQDLVDIDDGPRPPRVPAWMNSAKSVGEAQAQTLKTVGNLVNDNPKQAATIVRDWLSGAA
jgi:flagellar M-ring protein FliF